MHTGTEPGYQNSEVSIMYKTILQRSIDELVNEDVTDTESDVTDVIDVTDPDQLASRENQFLKAQLAKERNRAGKLQSKLRFIQDNYEIFNRLKEAYLSFKYNESASRPLVEIKEKSTQTWQGILCKGCVQFASVHNQHATDEDVVVRRKYLTSVRESFEGMKKSYLQFGKVDILANQRESKYRMHLTRLFEENANLKDLVQQKQKEIEDIEKSEEKKKVLCKERHMLRKIIVKLTNNLRQHGENVNLNTKEMKTVEHIMNQYNIKMKENPMYLSTSEPTSPFLTARSSHSEESLCSYRTLFENDIKMDHLQKKRSKFSISKTRDGRP